MTPRIIPVELFDLVVFGATGDLSQRKLLPALFHRDLQGQIPPGSRIIGCSRRAMTNEEFQAFARKAIEDHVPEADRPADVMARFLERVSYVTADAAQEAGWAELGKLLKPEAHRIRVFYLAVGPDLFGPICDRLGAYHLVTPQTRVVIEKPLGKSGASAHALNEAIGKVFKEPQIYRIDHYLGKETVQNLMALRFANALFEPVWNSGHIDHVQITVAETLGVEGRAGYYDTAGALRDMVQNHMLQLLCLVAMEPPTSMHADALRDEKLKVLRALKPITADAVPNVTVRGQYRAGAANGEAVTGYLEELGSDDVEDRDLRGAQGRDRQLALGGRALLPPHRQAAADARLGDRRQLQADPAFDVRRAGRADRAQPAGHPPAARRGREAVADDQGPGPGRHAALQRAARHELRRRLQRAQSRCL